MTEIPNKLFLKIGEVARITELEPHVLRYWESEFRVLNPRKNESGQRLYVRRDVETILRIKRLLHEDGYTISGAKKVLARRKNRVPPTQRPGDPSGNPARQQCLDFEERGFKETLKEIRNDLREVLSLLSS